MVLTQAVLSRCRMDGGEKNTAQTSRRWVYPRGYLLRAIISQMPKAGGSACRAGTHEEVFRREAPRATPSYRHTRTRKAASSMCLEKKGKVFPTVLITCLLPNHPQGGDHLKSSNFLLWTPFDDPSWV